MKANTLRTVLLVVIVGLVSGILYGQAAQDHSQHQATPAAAPKTVGVTPLVDNDVFCPTMSTGQLCSHGTTSVLGVTGAKGEQWLAAAHKYNKAVEAATKQLMTEAGTVLDEKQMAALKSWFSDEFNTEVNKLLHSKGLATVKK